MRLYQVGISLLSFAFCIFRLGVKLDLIYSWFNIIMVAQFFEHLNMYVLVKVFVQFVISFDTKIIKLEDGQMISRSFRGDQHHFSQFEHLVSAIYFIPFISQP